MPHVKSIEDTFCKRIVLIPTREKSDGWSCGSCFIESRDGWLRIMDYDCFRFTDADGTIKGDFEYDGIQFFREKGFIYSYGNNFKCV